MKTVNKTKEITWDKETLEVEWEEKGEYKDISHDFPAECPEVELKRVKWRKLDITNLIETFGLEDRILEKVFEKTITNH